MFVNIGTETRNETFEPDAQILNKHDERLDGLDTSEESIMYGRLQKQGLIRASSQETRIGPRRKGPCG